MSEIIIIPSASKTDTPLSNIGGLPTVRIKIHEEQTGFEFLMDTSVTHNLIDPHFMEWIVKDDTPTGIAFFDRYITPTAPIHTQIPPEKVMCKDGVARECEMIKLDFVITDSKGSDDDFSEHFAIDPSLSNFFLLPETYTDSEGVVQQPKIIAGVLGTGFLSKHGFGLNFYDGE